MGQGLEQREIEHCGQQQTEHQDRLAPDLVRQPAGDDEEGGPEDDADDQQVVRQHRIQLEGLGEKEHHIELRQVESHRLAAVDAEQRDQHHLEIAPVGEGVADRRLALLAFGLHAHEGGRFVHRQADPGGDGQQEDRQQERQAPAPDLELVAGQVAADQDHHQRQQQSQGRGGLQPAGMGAALAGRRVLGDVGGGAAVFAAQGQTLEQAQHHQDDGCGHADAGVGGQQADAEGGDAHEDDSGEKGVLAADHVAEAAEHQGAEGPHHEAGGKGQQGEDEGGGVVDAGEELLADHRRQGAIEKEVVPLEDGSQGRGEDHLAFFAATAGRARLDPGLGIVGHRTFS